MDGEDVVGFHLGAAGEGERKVNTAVHGSYVMRHFRSLVRAKTASGTLAKMLGLLTTPTAVSTIAVSPETPLESREHDDPDLDRAIAAVKRHLKSTPWANIYYDDPIDSEADSEERGRDDIIQKWTMTDPKHEFYPQAATGFVGRRFGRDIASNIREREPEHGLGSGSKKLAEKNLQNIRGIEMRMLRAMIPPPYETEKDITLSQRIENHKAHIRKT